jgi:hypothetical protein
MKIYSTPTKVALFLFITFICLRTGIGEPPVRFEILTQDHYLQSPIDSVFVRLFKNNVLIDSTFTDPDGRASMEIVPTGFLFPEGDLPLAPLIAYPNPFLTETRVSLFFNESQQIKVFLNDVFGRIIAQNTFQVSRGETELLISMGSHPQGVYFLNILGKNRQMARILKMGVGSISSETGIQLMGTSPQTDLVLKESAAEAVYSIRAEKNPYDQVEINTDHTSADIHIIDMERNNKVVIKVWNDAEQSMQYELQMKNGVGEFSVTAPDTLTLKSGIYSVSGETDTCYIAGSIEIVSKDTVITFFPAKKDEIDTSAYIASPDLIAEALEKGEITYEESLIYRAFSLIGDPRLPEKFNGNINALDDGTDLFLEIMLNEDILSQETLDILHPYRVRPNDPESIFSIGFDQIPGEKSVSNQITSWMSELAANKRARVWVPANADSSFLNTFTNHVNDTWRVLFDDNPLISTPTPDLPGPLTFNPDNAIDLYFVPLQTIDTRRTGCALSPNGDHCRFINAAGWAVSTLPSVVKASSSGYIIVDMSITGEFLVGVIAHELFHIGQFGYNFRESSWMLEATAVWAEFTALQRLGLTAKYLRREFITSPVSGFYRRLDKSLNANKPNIHQYSAYLYPLFVQQESGPDGHTVISEAWELSRDTEDLRLDVRAFDQLLPFRENFKLFARRIWNEDPVKPLFNEIDPGFPVIRPKFKESFKIEKGDELTIEQELAPLSSLYYEIDVHFDGDDEEYWKLRFDIEEFTNNPDAGIDAIVTISGKDPDLQEWSDESDVTFCLDVEEEKAEKIILIISNASMTDDLPLNIKIERIEPCEFTVNYDTWISWQWGDMVTYNYHYSTDIILERHDENGIIEYRGQDDLEIVNMYAIPGECQATMSKVADGSMEFTFRLDLAKDHECNEINAVVSPMQTPIETIFLKCGDDDPGQTLPNVSYGWSAWLTAHAFDDAETGFYLENWECGEPDSEIMAQKEYTLNYSDGSSIITVMVKAELKYRNQ